MNATMLFGKERAHHLSDSIWKGSDSGPIKANNAGSTVSACWDNSHCTNSVGSFDCSCSTGWTIDIIRLDNCVDVDEDRLL